MTPFDTVDLMLISMHNKAKYVQHLILHVKAYLESYNTKRVLFLQNIDNNDYHTESRRMCCTSYETAKFVLSFWPMLGLQQR